MTPVIKQSKYLYQGRLWTLPGGIHPTDNKSQSNQEPIKAAGIPDYLAISLHEYANSVFPTVQVGDTVLKGQIIADCSDEIGTAVHAPSSGTIAAIESRMVAHAAPITHTHIVIKTDGEDRWCKREPIALNTAQQEEIIEYLRRAGIVGLGGASFPSHIKLRSKGIETLIINGAECEPYISCDDRLMQDCAAEIIQGIALVKDLVKAKRALIAIEDNKVAAINAMLEQLENENQTHDIQIAVIPTKYPSGGEKQLIQILTGQEVPSDGLPSDVGILMHNVGTCYAIKRALVDAEPCLSRIVTLTGASLQQPGNYRCLIGTPIDFLLAHAGCQRDQIKQLIMGGPMMGLDLSDRDIAITKETNCLIAGTDVELPSLDQEQACIRCGDCARACPVSLLPQQLLWFAKAQAFDKAEDHHVMDCIECGACAYVCPSDIPLVHYYRFLKSEIKVQTANAAKSDHARKRFEFREQRLAREKAERAERHRKAAEERAARATEAGAEDANKQAILDAVKRVQAKKRSQEQNNDE